MEGLRPQNDVSLEKEIQEALLSKKKISQMSLEVVKKIKTSKEELHKRTNSSLYFLIHAGQERTALTLLESLFKKKISIPWLPLIYLLYRAKYKPNSEALSHFFDGCEEQESMESLSPIHPWLNSDRRFKSIRKKYIKKLIKKQEEFKNQLKEKLEYVKAHRMIHEENKVIHELEKYFPNDEDLNAAKNSFQERWAGEILSAKSAEQREHELILKVERKNKLPFLEIGEIIFKECLGLIENKPDSSYNLAIMFIFFEMYDYATSLLEKGTSSENSDWLLCELYIKSKKFIKALDWAGQLESKYADHPETVFKLTYLRSLALNGLSQTGSALELLGSLVKVRPRYRNAMALLNEWSRRAT